MKKILENIEDTWWETSDFSLRDSYRTHVRTNNSWRFVVSTHNLKGINTKRLKRFLDDKVVSTHNLKGINTRHHFRNNLPFVVSTHNLKGINTKDIVAGDFYWRC